MLSPAQQRGRLRSLIVAELKSSDLRSFFRRRLKDNNQDVSGALQRSVARKNYLAKVSVRSKIDKETGFINNIRVDIPELPWGRYGKKLDSEFGKRQYSTSPMYPAWRVIREWMDKKGLYTSGSLKVEVRKKLKSGSSKKYTYMYPLTGNTARNMLAYSITRKIIDRQQFVTRYPYADDMYFFLNRRINAAVSIWFEEQGAEYVADFGLDVMTNIVAGDGAIADNIKQLPKPNISFQIIE